MLLTPKLCAEYLEDKLAALGFSFFTSGDYNLNLIGVRSDRAQSGYFDDQLFCLYKVRQVWRTHVWAITTDPGARYLTKPINAAGTAILAAPQQCRGAYVIGKHRGHPALVQHGAAVRVWRDGNRDEILDWGSGAGVAGWYGINIHRARTEGLTDSPDYHSAGCQVFALRREHDAFMDLCRHSAAIYGDGFTYTIIHQVHINRHI
jgi:hypothetical protein